MNSYGEKAYPVESGWSRCSGFILYGGHAEFDGLGDVQVGLRPAMHGEAEDLERNMLCERSPTRHQPDFPTITEPQASPPLSHYI